MKNKSKNTVFVITFVDKKTKLSPLTEVCVDGIILQF